MTSYLKLRSFSNIENAFNIFILEFPMGFVFVINAENAIKSVKCAKAKKSLFFRHFFDIYDVISQNDVISRF